MMLSRPFKRDIRERIDDIKTRHLYACKCPRRRIARFGGRFGEPPRLLQGVASCHQHRCGRAMRLWWRIKSVRP